MPKQTKQINAVDISADMFRSEDFARVELVERSRIVPMREQPRKEFKPEPLEALSANILHQHKHNKGIAGTGIDSPLGGRWEPGAINADGSVKKNAKVLLTWGERRWRATGMEGFQSDHKLPLIITDATSEEAYNKAFNENFYHEPMTAEEVGLALQTLQRQQGLSQVELGERLGKSKGWVQMHIDLLGVDPDLRELVSASEASVQAAIFIQRADTPRQRDQLKTLALYGVSQEQLRIAKATPDALQAMLKWVKEEVSPQEFQQRFRDLRHGMLVESAAIEGYKQNRKLTGAGFYGTPAPKGQPVRTDVNANEQLRYAIQSVALCNAKLPGTTIVRKKWREETLPLIKQLEDELLKLRAIGAGEK